MLISLNWINELVESDAALTSESLDALLTSLGLEVDGVEKVGAGCETVIVGEVQSKAPHPKSNKLTVVQLLDGSGVVQVVCGAPNVPAPGGRVAFAPVGSKLPNGMEIGERTIRGVESRGMICSETELLIGEDGDGIIVLSEADVDPAVRDREFKTGARLVELVPGILDEVLELSITPNRPDALGHLGVARDIAVKRRCALRAPDEQAPELPTEASLVTIDAPKRCGRYIGHVLEGITVKASPLWMRVRLNRVGLRAINNCVDITNYVLMEYGHPLHAFDRAKLAEGRVVVRVASAGETMTALDGTAVELTDEDLVIADAKSPQALAGVMGGADSMVSGETATVLLEAAYFWPSGVRASARRHDFNTDSSYRFERGVGFAESLTQASLRALRLLERLGGGTAVASCDVDRRPELPTIPFRLSSIKRVLGYEVPEDEARRILRELGVTVTDDWKCTPPAHRPDLSIEEDLIEEIMRVYGLEDMPAQAAVPSEPVIERAHPEADLREQVIDALAEAGLREIVAYAFTSVEKLAPFVAEVPPERYVHVSNPLRSQHGVMRTHLLSGLLDSFEFNAARHTRPVALFEVGRVYAWPEQPSAGEGPTAEVDRQLPNERWRASVLLYGGTAGNGELSGNPIDARAAAGALIHALARVGLRGRTRPAGAPASYLHPGIQAEIELVGAGVVGRVGEVHPSVLDPREVPEGARVYYGELWLDQLPVEQVRKFREVSKVPSTARDISLELPVGLPAAVVRTALESAAAAVFADSVGQEDPVALAPAGPGAQAIELLEDYRGEGVPEGARALLFRLHYAAHERSVTDTEVQELHGRIVARACDAIRPQAPEVRAR